MSDFADQVGTAGGGDIVRQERIGDEIHRVDAAEDQTKPPDQRLPPIGPPSAVRRDGRRSPRRRATLHANDDKQCRQNDRHRPDDEAQAPAIVHQRQDERNGERDRKRLADEKSVGVNRGGESDALRKPGSHQRRQRRLHDRHARRHDDGRDVERHRIRVEPRARRSRQALISKPITKAGTMPKRAISNAPGTAAIANSIGGRPNSQPMSVSDRCRSACKSGMTGGIAKTVNRKQAPQSQSRLNRIRSGRMMALFRASCYWAAHFCFVAQSNPFAAECRGARNSSAVRSCNPRIDGAERHQERGAEKHRAHADLAADERRRAAGPRPGRQNSTTSHSPARGRRWHRERCGG